MNVNNNRPIGTSPGDQGHSPLDPDLTRVNREGVVYTREKVRENTEAAREQQKAQQEANLTAARRKLSQEQVELSTESRLRAAEESLGPDGRRETSEEREARVAELARAHGAGDLNTTERIRAAAGRLLGGD